MRDILDWRDRCQYKQREHDSDFLQYLYTTNCRGRQCCLTSIAIDSIAISRLRQFIICKTIPIVSREDHYQNYYLLKCYVFQYKTLIQKVLLRIPPLISPSQIINHWFNSILTQYINFDNFHYFLQLWKRCFRLFPIQITHWCCVNKSISTAMGEQGATGKCCCLEAVDST